MPRTADPPVPRESAAGIQGIIPLRRLRYGSRLSRTPGGAAWPWSRRLPPLRDRLAASMYCADPFPPLWSSPRADPPAARSWRTIHRAAVRTILAPAPSADRVLGSLGWKLTGLPQSLAQNHGAGNRHIERAHVGAHRNGKAFGDPPVHF